MLPVLRLRVVPLLTLSLWSGPLRLQTAAPASPPEYRVVELEPLPGCDWARWTGLNDRGEVCGTSYPNEDQRWGAPIPCVWSDGKSHALPHDRDQPALAHAMNNEGDVVGEAEAGGDRYPVIWRASPRRSEWLDTNPGVARLIGSDGSCVLAARGSFLMPGRRPLAAPDERLVRTTDMVDRSLIVGYTCEPSQGFSPHLPPFSVSSPRAVVWENGRPRMLPDFGHSSEARAVEAGGTIAGWAWSKEDRSVAVLWRGGKVEQLPTPEGQHGSAEDLNRRLEVVGSLSSPTEVRAVLWRDGKWFPLEEHVKGQSGWLFREALEINDRGQILVTGIRNDRKATCLLTPL
ncbi:MAG: hypothetical protein ACK47B_20165 [Armatimonadota bacterium]